MSMLWIPCYSYDVKVDNLYYNLNKEKHTAEVTYKECKYSKPVKGWIIENDYQGEIVVPETIIYKEEVYTVAGFSQSAFENSKKLTSITIPQSVLSIANKAFNDCRALTELIIEDGSSVLCLGYNDDSDNSHKGLFYECPLYKLYLGRNISYSQPTWASPFSEITTLTDVTMSDYVNTINNRMFLRCSGLTHLIIPNSVTGIGEDAFAVCYNLNSISIPNSVTNIGKGAFSYCALNTLTIPNTVTRIGDEAFSGCKNLTKIVIPNSIQEISHNLFSDCCSLTDIILPNTITTIGQTAFSGCSKLGKIVIPSSVKKIDYAAFEGCTSLSVYIPNTVTNFKDNSFTDAKAIYAYPAPYSRFQQSKKLHLIGAPILKVMPPTVTQTTATFNSQNIQEIPFGDAPEEMEKLAVLKKSMSFCHASYSVDEIIPGLTIPNLIPNSEYQIWGITEYSDGSSVYQSCTVKTRGTQPRIEELLKAATTFRCSGSYNINDATIEGEWFTFNDEKYPGNTFSITGLEPKKDYLVTYSITTIEGSLETAYYSFTTPALEFTTLQPKGVSSTCSIVAATTNISEDETNVGFQWKKYDAPSSLKPSEGYAAIYNGQLEGYIKNLQPTFYYNVRAFYKSAAGKYYYSDWVTFDPSDFSYFEPTVHTYEAIEVGYSSAKVKAYVMAGTDEVVEQGFEYWPSGTPENKVINVKATPAVESNISTVMGTGQVMIVTLTDLQPNSAYSFRSFVKTVSGTTYGEEYTFITENDPTGIDNVIPDATVRTVTGYYDIRGRKYHEMQKGLNIIHYSDGSIRKVMVK